MHSTASSLELALLKAGVTRGQSQGLQTHQGAFEGGRIELSVLSLCFSDHTQEFLRLANHSAVVHIR